MQKRSRWDTVMAIDMINNAVEEANVRYLNTMYDDVGKGNDTYDIGSNVMKGNDMCRNVRKDTKEKMKVAWRRFDDRTTKAFKAKNLDALTTACEWLKKEFP